MATVTVRYHSDFWDREKRITFATEKVTGDDGGPVFRAVARDVPDAIAREYAEKPDQFIVEGLEPDPSLREQDVPGPLNAKDTIALVETADAAGLEKLRATEEAREGGPRKSVTAAIEARAAVLKTPAD